MRPDNDRIFDVAILGTGIGGTLLGTILGANNRRVLLIEQGIHPRFAIGESTIPETTLLLRLLSKRYGVPEIANLSNFHSVRAHVSPGCGVKRNFSFHYHCPGQFADPRETNQFLTWAPPFGPDIHYFRQDVDAYMLTVAARYGATVRQQTQITEIRFDDGGVDLATADGESFRARYVVDAGGMRAQIPRTFDLREQPCRFRTRSRSVFTHRVGVLPYDRCAPPRHQHRLPSPLAQGTINHLFDGGWIWAIAFDNHPSSTNYLCSVGLTLDLAQHPSPQVAPEEEFRRIVSRFPSIARHFESARAVRPWIGTNQLQYSASATVGDRFCLLPHADSFVDPLFSSGLAVTVVAINNIAARLIAAESDDDLSAERFRYVQTWTKRPFDYYDRLVSGAYVSFRDYSLWNAWHRVWMVGSLYGAAGLFEILGRYSGNAAPTATELFETAPYRGLQGIDFEPFAELFDAAHREILRVNTEGLRPSEAAGRIFDLLAESGLCPAPWKLTDPNHRWAATLTLFPTIRLVGWGRYCSPPAVRQHYFRIGRTGGLLADLRRLWFSELRRAGTTVFGVPRDIFKSWNGDWRRASVLPRREHANDRVQDGTPSA